ncbi:MAG: hypothetical protein QNJ74_21560 [Trichodesmium sp. MO_231.B1]|nr:hypothetical protein [Trichodesmium sp. MO_231.B1]
MSAINGISLDSIEAELKVIIRARLLILVVIAIIPESWGAS